MSAEASELAFGTDAALHEVMRTMRAMRRLKPDPVPRDLLEQMVEAATWAPSGGNQQQYSWVIVTERDKMAELAELWRRCHDFYVSVMGDAPTDMLDARRREGLLDALRFQRDHFEETPAVIVACYDNSNVNRHLRSRWKQVLDSGKNLGPKFGAMLAKNSARAGAMAEAGSVYPGVQNLLLTARALGLAAAITTWHLFFEDEFKRVLGIPKGVHTFAVIPVGYPRGNFGPVRRRPAADAIHWEGW
jgi:nitroreductase